MKTKSLFTGTPLLQRSKLINEVSARWGLTATEDRVLRGAVRMAERLTVLDYNRMSNQAQAALNDYEQAARAARLI